MVSGVKVSLKQTESLQIGKNMAESDSIKEVVNQVAVVVLMAFVMALRDVEAGPWPTTVASQ